MTIQGRIHTRVVFDRTPEIRKGMRRRAEEATAKAAHDIGAHAQAGIRRHGLIDTGALLNSVQTSQVRPMLWRVQVGQSYGIYHEMGTRHLPARPFLAPGVAEVAPAYLAAMRQVVDR